MRRSTKINRIRLGEVEERAGLDHIHRNFKCSIASKTISSMTKARYLRTLTALLCFSLAAPVFAQESPDEPDPEAKAQIEAQGFRLPPQLRQVQYRDANAWVLHTNVRLGAADSTVSFGGLGTIAPSNFIPGADQTDFQARLYDDGRVILDEPRLNELDANGNQTTTPGGRYTLNDTNGNLISDFLAYTPGQTRVWAYGSPEQRVDGGVAMNQYSTASTGAGFQADGESSELGFEMAVSKRLLRFGRKVELSFSGAIGVSDFKASTSQRIGADLITMTDLYQVFGDVPTAPYEAPSVDTLTDPETGNIIPFGQFETTVPLQQVTPNRTFVTSPNGAAIEGAWGIDGAYYSMRFGPELRGHLTERISFTVGAGVLGAFVGSDFSVSEFLELDTPTINAIRFGGVDSMSELLIGYYAEASVEFWVTQRTGFFFGAVLESLDDFVQNFAGRTANVTLSDATLIRFGIIHRF